MLNIVIVDDEKEQRDLLTQYLQRYENECGEQFRLHVFQDAATFQRTEFLNYDIIFLDIQMPGIDGMTLSRKIREKDQKVVLIFVTNMAQFAIQGYEVEAMDFIVKPISYYRLASSLTKAMYRMNKDRGIKVVIRTKEGTYCIDSSKIYYIEMVNHHAIYHTEKGIYDSTGSLKKIEEKLEGQDFARCNNCYLVNLRYVSAVEGTEVIVGKERLLISRTRRKAFLQQMSEYFGGK